MSKIQVVWFDELQTWSVALQNTQKIQSKFKLVKLGEVLIDLTKMRTFTIKDDEFYQEPTISSKTNLITARKQGLGREFKVKRRVLILPDDLVIAKMHTQNGLYAFAKETFASTNTFIPFEIVKDKINKDYLFIILKMTLQRLQKFDSVNRETYTTNEILNLQIPLPPLDIQNKIVEDIQNIQAKIKALKEEEQRLKDEIEAYIYIALGLSKQEIGQKHKVFIVNFKDLERWDIRHNQNSPYLVPCDSALCHCEPPHSASTPCHFAPTPCHSERSEESINKTKNKRYFATLNMTAQKNNRFFANAQNDNATKKPKYPLVALGEICEIITGCTPQTNNKDFYGKEYPFYRPTDLNSGQISKSKIMLSSLGYQLHRPLPINSILVTCIGATIGKTAIIKRSGICNQQINAILPNEKFLPKYMYFLCNTQYFKDLLLQNSSITTIPIINKNIFSKIKIPLPPLKIQQEIVAFIESKNQQIKSCKESQTTLQEQLNSMLKESLL